MHSLVSIIGWLLMIIAVVTGIFFSVELTGIIRVQDFGVHEDRVAHTLLWFLPTLSLLSGLLLFRTRYIWSRKISQKFYWLLVGVISLVWCFALWHIRFRPPRHLTLDDRERMERAIEEAIEEWEKTQQTSEL